MFCCALLCVHSGFAIILFGREEPLAVSWVYLQFVIVVFLIILTILNVRRLHLISHVTNSKHIFFHFVISFFKDSYCIIICSLLRLASKNQLKTFINACRNSKYYNSVKIISKISYLCKMHTYFMFGTIYAFVRRKVTAVQFPGFNYFTYIYIFKESL